MKNISIVGAVGVPANYGGFETLAENLVKYHHSASLKNSLTIYCSSRSYTDKSSHYLSAQLKYVSLNANGLHSIFYDIISMMLAVWNRSDVILLLGVSGAIGLPLVRLFSSARIITNIDGVEWRREKWQGLAKHFLHFSERVAIRFSHDVIADNEVIANYVQENYGVKSHTIAYGGDHVLDVMNSSIDNYVLSDTFAFSVCRIEPENNVHIIVDAFSRLPSISLVVVGNWDYSEYGRLLREKYASCTNLYLLDSIYDLGKLKQLRSKASMFVHGHSAGGTNPSLVEAMHFGKVIFTFDCNYNRSTTEDKAIYFKSAEELIIAIGNIDPDKSESVGSNMLEIAKRRYTWEIIAKQYFKLLRI